MATEPLVEVCIWLGFKNTFENGRIFVVGTPFSVVLIWIWTGTLFWSTDEKNILQLVTKTPVGSSTINVCESGSEVTGEDTWPLLVWVEFETKESKLTNFTFEPNAEEILDELLPEYFENQLYVALLDSFASEHSARMISMQNATDNARELRSNLFLKFNRSRQHKITEELIDIISGSLN